MDLVLAVGVTLIIVGGAFALIGSAFDNNGYVIADFFYFLTAVCWGCALALAAIAALWWVWVRALD